MNVGGNADQSPSDTTVEATQKSIEILEFIREQGPVTLSEISRGTDNAKSTVYRHIKTLEDAGHICEYADGYRIGMLYLDYGIHAQRTHPLYETVKPQVDALGQTVGEKVWHMVEENDYAVFSYLKTGEELYRSFTQLGYRGHLHAFASGKCFLAFVPAEQVDGIIQRRGLPAYTEHTITDRDELFAALETIRDRGYAFHREEAVVGGHSVAAPIFGEDGSPLGAISIAGPAHRLSGEYFTEELPDLLLGVTNEIELSLKYESESG